MYYECSVYYGSINRCVNVEVYQSVEDDADAAKRYVARFKYVASAPSYDSSLYHKRYEKVEMAINIGLHGEVTALITDKRWDNSSIRK